MTALKKRLFLRDPLGLVAGPEQNFPGADYSAEETSFILAMERYKRERRRPFPTWREVLHVAHTLGYRKID